MATSVEDFWHQFDELDGRRSREYRKLADALRQLSPSSAHSEDPVALAAWQQYCESVLRLEQSVAELEQLVWRLGK